jgi:[acyl-carrier-protein] S-malonyltransferase
MLPKALQARLPTAALSFRGYNVTNLGRTAELLAQPAYATTLQRHLREFSVAASEYLGRPVDLLARVRAEQETTLDSYGDAVALIVAAGTAQLELLKECFDIDYHTAKFTFGYSLGEISALTAGGVLEPTAALNIPLRLADDCVALAHDVTLGVLFTRSLALDFDEIHRLCLLVNADGQGVVGVSAYLSPNTVLLMGQGDSLDRFYALAKGSLNVRVHLRRNDHRWPPLHTPIVWQRNIPNRAADLLHTTPLKLVSPSPPVLSLVTGQFSYQATNARHLIHQWIDHPQRLWDAIYETLASGATAVIHVGPTPNIVPATFRRLSENVTSQMQESISLRALSAAVRRQWLRRLVPQRAALLRAPYVEQIILEDWLLDNAPQG